MKSKIYILLFIASNFFNLSWSAGFDCNKTQLKDVEILICRDEYLSRLDNQLNIAYLKKSSQLTNEEVNKLKKSQREWLMERDTCQQQDCAAKLYLRRLNELSFSGYKERDLQSKEVIGGAKAKMRVEAQVEQENFERENLKKTNEGNGEKKSSPLITETKKEIKVINDIDASSPKRIESSAERKPSSSTTNQIQSKPLPLVSELLSKSNSLKLYFLFFAALSIALFFRNGILFFLESNFGKSLLTRFVGMSIFGVFSYCLYTTKGFEYLFALILIPVCFSSAILIFSTNSSSLEVDKIFVERKSGFFSFLNKPIYFVNYFNRLSISLHYRVAIKTFFFSLIVVLSVASALTLILAILAIFALSNSQSSNSNASSSDNSNNKTSTKDGSRKNISTAVQKGKYVNVYDENGSNLFSITGVLNGYTSSTVSVKKGNYIVTYNSNGSRISEFSST